MTTLKQLRLCALLLTLQPATIALAQSTFDPDQKYLVLEVLKLDTFERELNDAATQGFRMLMATTSPNGARIQALLERVAAPPNVFNYRMVATASAKTGDKEMNAAAAEGYRVVPHTEMTKKGLTIFNTNEVVVMEKAPAATAAFEYHSITAVRTATFHRELKTAVDEGWRVVGTTYGRVLLERQK